MQKSCHFDEILQLAFYPVDSDSALRKTTSAAVDRSPKNALTSAQRDGNLRGTTTTAEINRLFVEHIVWLQCLVVLNIHFQATCVRFSALLAPICV